MIDLDVRLVVVMVLTAAATGAVPVALGGALAIGGIVAAIFAARSVVHGDEGSVSTAIILGGMLAAASLSHGHGAALGALGGVFVGAELAAFGRRLGVDPESPVAPELRVTAATIGLGLAAGGAVAGVSAWRATPPLANAALAVLLLVAAITFAAHQLHAKQ